MSEFCECKNGDENVVVLKGKGGSFLKLIRSAAPEVKSETVVEETPEETQEVEQPQTKEISEEDLIMMKKLDYILRKIEDLRFKKVIKNEQA